MTQSGRPLIPVEVRFWRKVHKTEGCWLWIGATSRGYGKVSKGHRGEGYFKAHRFSWELAYGPIPEGKDVCHSCDNTICIRPDHLFLGTQADNIADMNKKGRHTKIGARGPLNCNTKLTANQVGKIRQLLASGVSLRTTAKLYNVHQSTICDIKYGRSWKYIKEQHNE